MINNYDDIKYVDELGRPSTAMSIANKHKVSRFKVRDLFSKHSPEKAYSLIDKDQRSLNGQRNIYFNDQGVSASSQELGDYYGVSRSTVQRKYRECNKDWRKANPLLAKYKTN